MQDGKILLMVNAGMVMVYPNADLKLAAGAQDALKAYQGQTQPAPAAASAAPGSSAKAGLTVDGVVEMLEAGISEDIIIERSARAANLSI